MNTTTDKVERVAKHELLDSAGKITEKFEEATALRYTDLASGDVFDCTPEARVNGQVVVLDAGCQAAMLAVFGGRTLATNEASASRQKDGTPADQMDAIRERFAGMIGPDAKWVDRTREGGPRIDLAILAAAVANVMVKGGTWAESDKAAKTAKVEETLKADSKKVATFRSLEGVEAEYKRLKGGKVATAADIAALVS